MNRLSIPLVLAASLLASGLVQASCQSAPTQKCLLVQAGQGLEAIDESTSRIDGMMELAAALAAGGDQREAFVLLLRAAVSAGAQPEISRRAELMASVSQAVSDHVTLGAGRRAATQMAEAALLAVDGVQSEDKRVDLRGKSLVALASASDPGRALKQAQALAEGSDNAASYKARTLKALASIAGRSDPDQGKAILTSITMGLSYYQATAYADLALAAAQRQDTRGALALLPTAVEIARAQDEGYFVGGALREAAMAYLAAGQNATADALFDEAVRGAKAAGSVQQQARAISRIASDLADVQRFDQARLLLPQAVTLAREESAEPLRMWCFYEIAGSAAASGDLNLAQKLLQEISPEVAFSGRPLLAAAQRDVAWGMARHGKTTQAIALAQDITSARERVQALSRIVRMMADPAMTALPRYL
ncbi:MAG: hypothetical protein AB8B96_01115 [Lysobacterales bacterium]